MDVLDPQVVWIGGKCYRKLLIKCDENEESNPRHSFPARKKPIDTIDDDEDDLPIENLKDNYFATYHVPGCLMGFLIGKKFATCKQIEGETSAKLKLPDRGSKISDVAIIGNTRQSVASAYRRIGSILFDARWKIGDYTHFISIPVNTEDIQKGFLNFKKDVLKNCKMNEGISDALFVKPSSLHLTIAMLALFDEREIESAKELLRKHQSEILEIIENKPFRIELKGVEYMNDDPGEINVLYGKVRETDSDNSLQLIADKLAKVFVNKNFARETGSVKLHVTLMKSRMDGSDKRMSFDARRILKTYADYSFGQMTISEIHLSIRFTAGDNYYKSSFVLQLNG